MNGSLVLDEFSGSEKSRKIPTKIPTKFPSEKKNYRRAPAEAQREKSGRKKSQHMQPPLTPTQGLDCRGRVPAASP